MEKYRQLGAEVLKQQEELRKESEKFIIKALYDHLKGEGTLVFEDDVMEEKDVDAISVSYNGGAHPEYASNCFSMLEGITLSNEKGKYEIYLLIEEDGDYPLEELSDMEVYNVAYFLEEYLC